MKRKLIVSLALSALLMSACDTDGQTAEVTRSDIPASISEDTAAEPVVSEQTETAVSEETVSETEKTEAETATAVSRKTVYNVLETEIPDFERTAPNVNIDAVPAINPKLFDLDSLMLEYDAGAVGYNSATFLNDDMFCQPGYFNNDDTHSPSIFFYSISEMKITDSITLPEEWRGIAVIDAGSDDVLCNALIYKFDEDYNNVYAFMTVYNDLEYDIAEYTPQSFAVEHYGRSIFSIDDEIYTFDRNGGKKKILPVSGAYQQQVYACPIDENRFVFWRVDYSDPNSLLDGYIGVYDFESDTATEISATRGFHPIGAHDNKIYSYSHISRLETEMYVTDAETFETEYFSPMPFEFISGEAAYYAMPESGDYILIIKCGETAQKIPVVAYIMDPDTGEITAAYEIPEEIPFSYYAFSDIEILNEKTAVLKCSHHRKLFLFDIEY